MDRGTRLCDSHNLRRVFHCSQMPPPPLCSLGTHQKPAEWGVGAHEGQSVPIRQTPLHGWWQGWIEPPWCSYGPPWVPHTAPSQSYQLECPVLWYHLLIRSFDWCTRQILSRRVLEGREELPIRWWRRECGVRKEGRKGERDRGKAREGERESRRERVSEKERKRERDSSITLHLIEGDRCTSCTLSQRG